MCGGPRFVIVIGEHLRKIKCIAQHQKFDLCAKIIAYMAEKFTKRFLCLKIVLR